ncbi:hypothetical protein SEVIR_8G182900v4 [Setaria viridis]|uniref:Uncharacterized protein n=1 Tax=Setaria viridis TaxID=4556 RepID=A0A4U6TGP4_SETVI|nr:hypothetical protein SEVIR_8G182900v2 [Setaria viridis]
MLLTTHHTIGNQRFPIRQVDRALGNRGRERDGECCQCGEERRGVLPELGHQCLGREGKEVQELGELLPDDIPRECAFTGVESESLFCSEGRGAEFPWGRHGLMLLYCELLSLQLDQPARCSWSSSGGGRSGCWFVRVTTGVVYLGDGDDDRSCRGWTR